MAIHRRPLAVPTERGGDYHLIEPGTHVRTMDGEGHAASDDRFDEYAVPLERLDA